VLKIDCSSDNAGIDWNHKGNPLSEITEARKNTRRLPPQFELIAGNVGLDFVNTLDDRHTQPKELLRTYLDLARFGEDAGLLDSTQANQLYERSYMEPDRAQEVLLWGRELRESIHDVFWAIMNKRPVPALALARLNADAQGAAQHMSLVPSARGTKGAGSFVWKYDDLRAFDSVLWPIARAAADLLTSDKLPYVRACLSKTCEWFFLDTSKSHHRRWCDMTRCGNRAKGQRFYARKKKASS
jgi:predicted RNA-binding Zn ribbon-like protein